MKATKKLVHGNTDSHGTISTDAYLQATLTYRNNTIYPETGKSISQSLLGRNLRDSLPAVKTFYEITKEYVMERDEWELVAARCNKMAMEAYNPGSENLPPLQLGDSIRVQNQTTTRTTKWDRTGVITDVLICWKYEVLMDGSRHLSI